jgi:hypothetical protein
MLLDRPLAHYGSGTSKMCPVSQNRHLLGASLMSGKKWSEPFLADINLSIKVADKLTTQI